MSKYTVEPIEVAPEFDMFFYCAVSQENRIDNELMEEFGPQWDEWTKHLKAYTIKNTEGEGQFVIIYLEQPVEDVIEGIWQDSPTHGLAFHNLAITMVMSAAQGLIPEMEEKGCAPLPRPGKGVQEAFGTLGLEWNEEGTCNRQYAVFTNYPYTKGCEICFLVDKCPKAVKQQ